MRPVGVLCALPQEIALLLDVLEGERVRDRAGMRFHAGRLDGYEVVLARAGMGKVNAAIATTLLVERFDCRLVLFSGVAGGLDPEAAIGDVVIADHIVQHDAGYHLPTGFTAYQAGHLPFFNPHDGIGYTVDDMLVDRVRAQLSDLVLAPLSHEAGGQGAPPRLHYARVLTGDQFVASEEVRERLHSTFGGTAVEMEGGAMAQACAALGVPWLVIRALSDLAGRDSHLDFARFADEVASSSALIVRRLLGVV